MHREWLAIFNVFYLYNFFLSFIYVLLFPFIIIIYVKWLCNNENCEKSYIKGWSHLICIYLRLNTAAQDAILCPRGLWNNFSWLTHESTHPDEYWWRAVCRVHGTHGASPLESPGTVHDHCGLGAHKKEITWSVSCKNPICI